MDGLLVFSSSDRWKQVAGSIRERQNTSSFVHSVREAKTTFCLQDRATKTLSCVFPAHAESLSLRIDWGKGSDGSALLIHSLHMRAN